MHSVEANCEIIFTSFVQVQPPYTAASGRGVAFSLGVRGEKAALLREREREGGGDGGGEGRGGCTPL